MSSFIIYCKYTYQNDSTTSSVLNRYSRYRYARFSIVHSELQCWQQCCPPGDCAAIIHYNYLFSLDTLIGHNVGCRGLCMKHTVCGLT